MNCFNRWIIWIEWGEIWEGEMLSRHRARTNGLIGHGLDTPSLLLYLSLSIVCWNRLAGIFTLWCRLYSFRWMSMDRTSRLISMTTLDTSPSFSGPDVGWCDELTKEHLTMRSTCTAWSCNDRMRHGQWHCIFPQLTFTYHPKTRLCFLTSPTYLTLPMMPIVHPL